MMGAQPQDLSLRNDLETAAERGTENLERAG
jgi:hypothetical protein